jgi:signal transduction histidine kinase
VNRISAPETAHSSPYRDVLDTPGISRVHDFQRLVSYGVAIVLSFLVDLPSWRTTPVLIIATIMFSAAVWRLTTGYLHRPYLLAQTDVLAAGTAIALATASAVLTLAAVIVIAGAIAATFRTPIRRGVPLSLATGIPPVVIAYLVDTSGDTGNVAYIAVLILTGVMLALSAFVVGVFIVQTRYLRSQLRHRESQLSSVLEVTPVVLAAVGGDGTLTTLAGDRSAWEELVGQRLEAGSEIAQLVGKAVADGRSSGDVGVGDRTFNVTCDRNDAGETLLTVYDVTDRTLARKHLEGVVRSKDQFIAAVSHELRTPLASVVGFSELIQERTTADDPLHDMITEVADQSAEMAAIIDDLLIAARASFESVPTEPRHIKLAAETATVIESIGSRISNPPEAYLDEVTAFADPIRVRQIIRNLLTNADRYGGDRIEVATAAAGSDAVLFVRDSGPPLPPERRELIFEPYESSGPVRGQPAAIGLGLAVSRTLAELMGGSIGYDHDGNWSIFVLRLPGVASKRSGRGGSSETSLVSTPREQQL